ncbi:MAG: carboxypeptidase-like regulatory domain-containing protein, partial [Bryobacteraceae bacterium]
MRSAVAKRFEYNREIRVSPVPAERRHFMSGLGFRGVLAVAMLVSIPLAAQIGSSGTIKGTVTDPSGAIIPGAAVIAQNVATGVESRRETSAAG